tara:strand:+ start:672 stop:896 length:225 start_codon:yes stop_codon:yes gene_type:complete
MSRLTTYHYAVMPSAIADDHRSELQFGTRTSVDSTTVIGKLPSDTTIEGAEMMGIAALLTYIATRPELWSDPTI